MSINNYRIWLPVDSFFIVVPVNLVQLAGIMKYVIRISDTTIKKKVFLELVFHVV